MAKKSSKKGDPLIGAVIERRWQVLDQLGAGGMGVVYRAERINLGKQVALKFLHQSVAESKAAVARFEREAKAISRLHHVHCISILDFGVYRRQPYIVMEFVQGRQLNELDLTVLTPTRAVALLRQVLLGLQHAHSRGVIHRDLKLSNIMLVEMTGTENLVKLLDFGLARISGINEELSLTEGMVAGTPSYMSPEQALGKKTDQRSDIYSAGVVLYVLCTGKRPFTASDTTALLRMQIDDPPPPPRRAAPAKRISEGLERVILRALEKKPADRFQSVTEFLTALDDTQEGQETLTPTVVRDKPRRWRRRMLGIAAAACIALGAMGALWARGPFLQLRTRALGAYQRWMGPSAPPAPAAHEPVVHEPVANQPVAHQPVVP
ncbi:MAG: serine/threonine protein kinase, partial [Polyangia bacterium]